MSNHLSHLKIVCLGGGIGTSNLLRGLKPYGPALTIVTSMADDGGSSGRLRKAYGIMPPGDIVSCIAAMIDDQELSDLLTYRFPGLSKNNKAVDGHKLGNLIMFAEILRTGNFYSAIEITKRLFGVKGEFLPATDQRIRLSGVTKDGRVIHSETTLDLARYTEPHGLRKIYITPKHPVVNSRVIECIMKADLIISGPGDLFTNQLPVLVIPELRDALKKTNGKKVFICNVANKPFETRGYKLSDYISAIEGHLNGQIFDAIIVNDKTDIRMPKKFKYSYVDIDTPTSAGLIIHRSDLINNAFPIYHDAIKLASAVNKLYNRLH